MKKLIVAALLALSGAVQAQNHWCATDQHNQRLLEENPSAINALNTLNQFQENANRGLTNELRGGGPRIIPTVFHVIHMGGIENISRAQILNQIETLNLDYTRTNLDTSNTREIFKPVAGSPNVEFRLATLDPDGNCTDGVVRVMSPLTDNADDAVKELSYWPSNRYFNVWIVRSIASDGAGTTLGYAQFPGFGSPTTDGVVMRHDYTGSIGTAAQFGGAGRTLTHEVGHWLGLFHTFQGGCSGGFFGENIDDTPPVAEANFNCNFNLNSCSNDNPNLPDQIENYMDYTGGTCQNMFTNGQIAMMNQVLSGSRANIVSAGNLALTGTTDVIEPQCAPIAALTVNRFFTCAGSAVTFSDASFNGTVTQWAWQFPGGTPGTSTAQNPSVTYAQPGVYSATLTASNDNGGSSYTENVAVTVVGSTPEQSSFVYQEGFEDAQPNLNVFNIANMGTTWERVGTAFTGTSGYKINIRQNVAGAVDEFILPSLSLSQMNSPSLTFRVAHRQRNDNNTISQERLRVFVSTNCGETWAVRYNKAGSSLATVSGAVSQDWAPTSATDWRLETVSLSNFANAAQVFIKFQSTSDAGNSIYVDDINISGPAGISNESFGHHLSLYPSPANESTVLEVEVVKPETVTISITDAIGRTLSTRNVRLNVGLNTIALNELGILAPGHYVMQLLGSQGRASVPFVR